jgi:hypothetical protein
MIKSQWAINLLKDDYFIEMMQELRNSEINKFTMSDYNQIEQREEAYMRLRCFELVENHLQSMAADKLIKDKKLKIL